jgi:hypothetical protein
MADKRHVIGLFSDGERAVSAIRALKGKAWAVESVYTPIPHHGIMEAVGPRKSRVGYFTLAGGILGFLSGIGLAIFTATRWDLIVSGKPVVALIPFLIVGFEFTILFAVFGNITGFLIQARLPDLGGLKRHCPVCTGDRFGVVAACREGEEEEVAAFLKEQGAESSLLHENSDSSIQ